MTSPSSVNDGGGLFPTHGKKPLHVGITMVGCPQVGKLRAFLWRLNRWLYSGKIGFDVAVS
jgi:hypothetical protein